MIELKLCDIAHGYKTGVVDRRGTFHEHGTFKFITFKCANCKEKCHGTINDICQHCLYSINNLTEEQQAAKLYYEKESTGLHWWEISEHERNYWINKIRLCNVSKQESVSSV